MRHEHADSLAGVTRIAAFIFRPQMKPETTVISAPGGWEGGLSQVQGQLGLQKETKKLEDLETVTGPIQFEVTGISIAGFCF